MPGIHHLEIWVAEDGTAAAAWGWLLPRLGFRLTQEWPQGRTWSDGGTYLTLTTPPNLTADRHDRRRPGMNHVAFDGGTPADVDALMAAAPAHGWAPLYAERYPHAGGPDHYAGWLENAAGFKVEVVADSAGRVAEVPYRALPLGDAPVRYAHGPDSSPRPGTPAGRTASFDLASTVFPGTTRRVWIHAPPGIDAAHQVGVAVFLDGWWYLDPDGEIRGGVVLDNLVRSGQIPPIIGVFVDPGVFPDAGDPEARKNRNAEYDAADDRLARLLLDEVVPEVRRRHALSDDPARWAVIGGSSGGNAAFTVAWHRPEQFGRVTGFLSSFAQMPGGNPYPELIADTPRKPLRVLLQAGHRDLGWNEPEHNWFAENLRTAAALAEAGYDARLVLGDGGHDPNHAGVLLPDALRWLWRDARVW
ncbi:enterochelin esterase-like enzyme [Isoptericola chiayiensis]|nr:enterochelin esterase-like enzyme [Isoptericola chiayiensis]